MLNISKKIENHLDFFLNLFNVFLVRTKRSYLLCIKNTNSSLILFCYYNIAGQSILMLECSAFYSTSAMLSIFYNFSLKFIRILFFLLNNI